MDDKTREKWERSVEDALWQFAAMAITPADASAWGRQMGKIHKILDHLTALRLK